MNPNHIVLAGGSGFLGRSYAARLAQRGIKVSILTRTPHSPVERPSLIEEIGWDGCNVDSWWQVLEGAHAVINFTGKSVNCRYTPQNKREIIDSRINSVRAIGEALGHCRQPPLVWVQAGSLAIYGDAGDRICDENAPHGEGFGAQVCELWEEAFAGCKTPGTRKVYLRISFVLGEDGGALATLTGLTRWYLGGMVGNGRQYVSWIHIEDFNALLDRAIADDTIDGIYNATAPTPVTNSQFMFELRQALGRPYSPPVPTPLVRLGAALIGTEAELALTGRRAVPRRFEQAGFTFEYPNLAPALREILA